MNCFFLRLITDEWHICQVSWDCLVFIGTNGEKQKIEQNSKHIFAELIFVCDYYTINAVGFKYQCEKMTNVH